MKDKQKCSVCGRTRNRLVDSRIVCWTKNNSECLAVAQARRNALLEVVALMRNEREQLSARPGRFAPRCDARIDEINLWIDTLNEMAGA